MSTNIPYYPTDEHQLVLTREATWLHDGDSVTHKRLSLLLHRSIQRNDEQSLILSTGRDTIAFSCEDTPLFVHKIELNADANQVQLLLSDQSYNVLEQHVFYISADNRIRVAVKNKQYWALFLASAHQFLLNHLQQEHSKFYIQIGNLKIPLVEKDFSPQELAAIPFSLESC